MLHVAWHLNTELYVWRICLPGRNLDMYFYRGIDPRQLSSSATKFWCLFCDKDLWKVMHHFLDAIPPNQIEFIPIDHVFIVIQFASHLGTPIFFKCRSWWSCYLCIIQLYSQILGEEFARDKLLLNQFVIGAFSTNLSIMTSNCSINDCFTQDLMLSWCTATHWYFVWNGFSIINCLKLRTISAWACFSLIPLRGILPCMTNPKLPY